jgi:3-deoxy-D-manno-octulosonic-acid transferase
VAPQVDVLLGDSMGEMFAYYSASDCAFIGGSLLPLGGQNLIEACALGKPVLIGDHTFNFALVTEEAVAAGAALRVADAGQMLREAARLLQDADARVVMGGQAWAFANRHRGATARTLELLRRLIY